MKNNWIKINLKFWWLWWSALTALRAQEYSRWIDMLSYLKIKDLEVHDGRLSAAVENAFFIYDEAAGEFEKFSTVKGLSGKEVTAYHYHPYSGKHFIAHADGKIEIIFPDGKVFNENNLYVSLAPDENKIIRAVASGQRYLYLAMPYGITAYDIQNLEFGDTYYIGSGGRETSVNDVKIWQGNLYAATEGEGIKYIEENNPDKLDFTQWKQIDTGTWTLLFPYNGKLYGVKGWSVYEIDADGVRQVYGSSRPIRDLGADSGYFYVATRNEVIRLDAFFNESARYVPTADLPFKITAIYAAAGKLFIGTEQHGVVIASEPGNYRSVHPDSPLMNIPFASDVYNGYLWTVYGDYDQLYNPYPLDRRGISVYHEGKWTNIPYKDFQAVSLTDVKIKPSDTTVVFVGSFHDGLLEFRHGSLFKKYDGSNAPFPPIVVNNTALEDYRISPLIFDQEENLWMFQGLVLDGIHKFDTRDQWQTYSFETLMTEAYNEGAAQMDFDRDGNLWLATHRLGVVGLNPETGRMIALTERNGIPYENSYRNTQAVTIDKDNVMWIGTLNGLRILRNPGRAFTDPSIQAERIIIELEELEGQDNQGVELLANTEISEIVVDGANNKWIGTTNAGVFYLSEDGQKTIYRFTEKNSPLPGNSIFDIAVDPVTGLVVFSTDRGLIGFKGDASEGMPDLQKAYVYPNPVNMKRHDHLIIRNLMTGINVKITDIEGNLVYETRSKGGSVRWNLKNFAGISVASGVYLILLTDKEGEHTRVLKALIIR